MIYKDEHVICLIDYSGASDFFVRLASNDPQRTYTFITCLYSNVLKIKSLKNAESIFLSYTGEQSDDKIPFDLRRCRESFLGLLSIDDSQLYFSRLLYECEKVITKRENLSITILLWNGESISGNTARILKDKYSFVETIFFEIANLPGKIFANNMGVNASSSLALNTTSLLELDVDEVESKKWISNFINDKVNGNYVPPQAKLIEKLSVYNIVDFCFSFLSFRFFSYQSILSKLKINKIKKNYLSMQNNKTTTCNFNTIPNEYVFLPLQVSSDSQLLLNSDVNNLQALELVLSKTNKHIIVKPHPAERDISYIYNWLNDSKFNDRVTLSELDTYELIQKSIEVFVINSTVGFEAMLMDKKVTFLGRSMYSNFTTKCHIYKYISSYLIDVDFFSQGDISKDLIEKVYSYNNRSQRS